MRRCCCSTRWRPISIPRGGSALYDALSDLGAQVFMTGADPLAFAEIADRAQIFEVTPGQVRAAHLTGTLRSRSPRIFRCRWNTCAAGALSSRDKIADRRRLEVRWLRTMTTSQSTAAEEINERLQDAIDGLRKDVTRVEVWATALGTFSKPVPDYQPDEKYPARSRRLQKRQKIALPRAPHFGLGWGLKILLKTTT